MACSPGVLLFASLALLLITSILVLIFASQVLQDYVVYLSTPYHPEVHTNVPDLPTFQAHMLSIWPVYISCTSAGCSIAITLLSICYRDCGNSRDRSCFQARYKRIYISFVFLLANALLAMVAFLCTWIVFSNTSSQDSTNDAQKEKCAMADPVYNDYCGGPKQFRYILIPYLITAISAAVFGLRFLMAEERADTGIDARNGSDIEMDLPPRYETTDSNVCSGPLGHVGGTEAAFKAGKYEQSTAASEDSVNS
ncbi:hypothetical protein NA57DRAFT_75183 [Rhizodiscina lignyota]|uniref:Uncharacterized protein n=1 Tax=Rhizodiscina lignyota TaxID=1504668 RepID=A0A9P4IDN7_9PEZI|nr:hypothetical protein NA57DRAFT_75183 [Rhizodiscina lignyota]